MVLDGFGWFRVVSDGFRWSRVVCCFSSYPLNYSETFLPHQFKIPFQNTFSDTTSGGLINFAPSPTSFITN